MIGQLSATQILSLLDKVAKLYPGGIPKSAVVAPMVNTTAQDHKRVLLLALSENSLEPALMTLAQAICIKGLKLPLAQCEIRSIAADSISRDEAVKIAQPIKFPIIIILGGGNQPGTFEHSEGSNILWSYSITDIASDPIKKRDFWEQLKGTINRGN